MRVANPSVVGYGTTLTQAMVSATSSAQALSTSLKLDRQFEKVSAVPARRRATHAWWTHELDLASEDYETCKRHLMARISRLYVIAIRNQS
jgi:hypothetical protein